MTTQDDHSATDLPLSGLDKLRALIDRIQHLPIEAAVSEFHRCLDEDEQLRKAHFHHAVATVRELPLTGNSDRPANDV